MASMTDFWKEGPHDPIPVEETWREFVRSVGGVVVEDLLSEPRTFQNADFLFQAIPLVAELKEVETEFDRSPAFQTGYIELLERVTREDPSWRPKLFGGHGQYPAWFNNEFVRLFRDPISRILKKANRQIRETKTHFGIAEPTGMVIFVNDGFTQLEPHFIRSLACNILASNYSSIDCFLYVTVNRYVEITGTDVPRLLWMPSYSDRSSANLVDFVDDLGRKWFQYLETKIGPFTIPPEELPQDNGEARTMLSRSIVLPNERR